jgi:hypothetical protein
MRRLGAKASKQLPENWLGAAGEEPPARDRLEAEEAQS